MIGFYKYTRYYRFLLCLNGFVSTTIWKFCDSWWKQASLFSRPKILSFIDFLSRPFLRFPEFRAFIISSVICRSLLFLWRPFISKAICMHTGMSLFVCPLTASYSIYKWWKIFSRVEFYVWSLLLKGLLLLYTDVCIAW